MHSRLILNDARLGEDITLCFSPDVDEALKGLRRFMFDKVYHGEVCALERERAAFIVRFLFEYYSERPELMPEFYQSIAQQEGIERGVADYISGMSDNYCVELFKDLTIPRSFLHTI